jgi:glycosyltransferase involved in cell wall biosynthesis
MSLRDPMRPVIHWVSPLPPAATDIAHYTARILPALTQHARVVLWTDAEHWDASLETYAPIQRFDADRLLPSDLQRAARLTGAPEGARQMMFIHIGNSWVFHANMLRLARRMSSVVVLHDLAIQELMKDAITNHLFDSKTYLEEMAAWYGLEGHQEAQRSLSEIGYAQKLAPRMPGFELALPAALAVLTHTPMAVAAAKERDIMPVHHLELPFQPGASPSIRRPWLGPLRLLQFGYIGPNRRLTEVLETLAGLKDQIDFRFDVMGNLWDPLRIRQEIAALGLETQVHLHGFVPEPVLDAALRQAHLVLNLRFPTLGEASGSQLRIWNAGAAAVVRKAGWYADLPEHTVFHIPDDNDTEASALQTLIHRIAKKRGLVETVCDAGYARLLSHHHPDDYAQRIVEIAQNIGPAAGQHLYEPTLFRKREVVQQIRTLLVKP